MLFEFHSQFCNNGSAIKMNETLNRKPRSNSDLNIQHNFEINHAQWINHVNRRISIEVIQYFVDIIKLIIINSNEMLFQKSMIWNVRSFYNSIWKWAVIITIQYWITFEFKKREERLFIILPLTRAYKNMLSFAKFL